MDDTILRIENRIDDDVKSTVLYKIENGKLFWKVEKVSGILGLLIDSSYEGFDWEEIDLDKVEIDNVKPDGNGALKKFCKRHKII